MRTLTTIAVIVLLLIGGSYASYHYIQTTTQTTGEHLKAIEESISSQKWEIAKTELSNVLQNWDKNYTWWSILLDHQELDAIGVCMKRLESYVDRQDVTLSLGEVSSLKLLFENIYETEKFSLKNVF